MVQVVSECGGSRPDLPLMALRHGVGHSTTELAHSTLRPSFSQAEPATMSSCQAPVSCPARSGRLPEAGQDEVAKHRQHVGRHRAAHPKYGPGNQYSVNYMWGTVGLGPIVSGIGTSNQRGAVHDLEGTLFDAGFTVAIARPCAEAERSWRTKRWPPPSWTSGCFAAAKNIDGPQRHSPLGLGSVCCDP